jgi:hypothetical protein
MKTGGTRSIGKSGDAAFGEAFERHTLIVGHGYCRLMAPIRDIIGLAMHCNRAICVAFA